MSRKARSTRRSNQVASGLALTLFGVGLSAFVGKPFESVSLPHYGPLEIPYLSQIPVVGTILFKQHALVYVSWALFAGVSWFLYKSRAGLVLRSIGESPESAHAIGYPVIRIRYLATLFGGAMAGLAGAHLSEFYAPMWAEGMVAGRGWIALALVVFATWRPARVMVGAYLFGGVTIAQFFAQGSGVAVTSQLLSALEVRDAAGETVYKFDATEIGRAVSVETAQLVAQLLTGVASKNGTAPEAAIDGFDVHSDVQIPGNGAGDHLSRVRKIEGEMCARKIFRRERWFPVRACRERPVTRSTITVRRQTLTEQGVRDRKVAPIVREHEAVVS